MQYKIINVSIATKKKKKKKKKTMTSRRNVYNF